MTTTSSTQPLTAPDQPTPDGPKHSRQAQAQTPAQAQPVGAVSPPAGTPPATAPASDDKAPSGGDRSVSVWTMLLFIAGCTILVAAAWNLPNLARWGDDYGAVFVFLAFFMVMSIGGRWFWTGIDAIWSAVRGRDNA